MKTKVLEGSPQQIADGVVRIDGRIIQAIVLIEEPGDQPAAQTGDDMFSEMDSDTVQAGGADYSRQGIYSPRDGE